jgi:flavin-dependent dehydrogenase
VYAIIGAGPAGLAAARNLNRQGLAFVGFELHAEENGVKPQLFYFAGDFS